MIFLDFECFVSGKYRLGKNFTTEDYIRDAQFQPTMLAIAENGGAPQSAAGPDAIDELLASIDWPRKTVCMHNAQFDSAILAFHYGLIPEFILDTLAIARGTFGLTENVGLADLSKRYGLPDKSVPYDEISGLRFEDMPPELVERLRAGCERDVLNLREIFKRLAPGFPKSELLLIDLTMRMFITPTIYGDVEMLRRLVASERTRKESTARELGVDESVFRSTAKFVALLESLGEKVATKTNPKGEPIPATDTKSIFMLDLMERDDRVGELARAKVDLSSSINEKRAEKILAKAIDGRPLPIQLKPYGTVTARWAGAGDRMNFQNLPRDNQIRDCLVAPPGYLIIDVDLSQIECRVLNAMARQTDVLEALANPERDIYAELATKLYGRLITKKTDENARNVGKTCELSCGYQAGLDGKTFQQNCRNKGLNISIETARMAVATYRVMHPYVVRFWAECERVLHHLFMGASVKEIGPVKVRRGALILPNGLELPYALKRGPGKFGSDGFLRLERTANGEVECRSTYGGKLAENLSSSLARVILGDLMTATYTEMGLRPFLTVHDSLTYLVPQADAETAAAGMLEIAHRTPAWWSVGAPPIAAEAKIGARYGRMKEVKRKVVNT
ncbi:MAG: DNA polymerase [Methylocella sp.]